MNVIQQKTAPATRMATHIGDAEKVDLSSGLLSNQEGRTRYKTDTAADTVSIARHSAGRIPPAAKAMASARIFTAIVHPPSHFTGIMKSAIPVNEGMKNNSRFLNVVFKIISPVFYLIRF